MEFIDEYEKYDFSIKICLVGEISVGKTLFLERIEYDKNLNNSEFFNNHLKNYHPTFVVDFKIFAIKFKNKIIKIQIVDCSGDENFEKSKFYFRKCKVFLIMYNFMNRNSFEKGEKIYYDLIKNYNNSIYYLIRCKYDLSLNALKKESKNDFVTDEEALEFATINNIFFAHISCKEKHETGIKELFTNIFNQIDLFK